MPIRVLQTVAVSAQAATPVTTLAWIPLNLGAQDFEVTYVATRTGSGTVNYRIQGTLDDVLSAGVSAVAFDLASGATGNLDGSVQVPITAIRLQVVSASASSDVSFRVLQSGY